jgi:hypothetical protein
VRRYQAERTSYIHGYDEVHLKKDIFDGGKVEEPRRRFGMEAQAAA